MTSNQFRVFEHYSYDMIATFIDAVDEVWNGRLNYDDFNRMISSLEFVITPSSCRIHLFPGYQHTMNAVRRAEQIRDKIFLCYGYFGTLENEATVRIPREGDWIKWIADAIYLADNERLREEHNPNMDGAKEFINALMLNQPIWPNQYGQDVSAAAFFIYEERLKAQVEKKKAFMEKCDD